MSVYNSTGSTLAICASLPSSYDAAGYGALTFTTIGSITSITGDIGGMSQESSHIPLATGIAVKDKGAHDPGTITAALVIDASDAGQVIALAASLPSVRTRKAFKLTRKDGKIHYFHGPVLGFPVSVGDANARTEGQITVAVSDDGSGNFLVTV
jgi:hypothetical protein